LAALFGFFSLFKISFAFFCESLQLDVVIVGFDTLLVFLVVVFISETCFFLVVEFVLTKVVELRLPGVLLGVESRLLTLSVLKPRYLLGPEVEATFRVKGLALAFAQSS